MQFNKQPLTYSQQVDLWEQRGLTFPDKAKAEFYFQNISYYRLSAYALPFQQEKDKFNAGTEFDNVLDLYKFDRELRLVVLDAIERIEVALRTQFIYSLSHKYGSHWQNIKAIYKPAYKNHQGRIIDIFQETQSIIRDHCLSKYPEVFIRHYLDTYTQPPTPPSWMAIELLTIGQLSRLFSGLANNDDKRAIASYFSLHHTPFESWLHALTYGRNLCAHHSRFWNRDFVIQADIPKKNLKLPWINYHITNNCRCFYFLSVVKYFLQTINPEGHFKQRILDVMNKYPVTPIRFMGIPTDAQGNLIKWQSESLWQQ